ncbi:nuclear mitotic apparatus protein 1-like isoform X2 [Dreissena polymorpha]|uniref:nuclear mitotic apparatus protein 1-like isoform X2 n=1 Tax=Dreissena polymorpha TaxID=45954 RepID=UPI0022650F72|nr:nuclear mitotic apparatus protein 1-like isoform X2 [Dreissena polymorpha]
MDPDKKTTLVHWFNLVSESPIRSLDDLRDGVHIVKLLLSCGDILPSDVELDTQQQRITALKNYLEGFYRQSFDDNQLINFDGFTCGTLHGDVYDFEMGKLLLALLGCLVQEKCRTRFINPAMSMEPVHQLHVKEMVECIVFSTSDYLTAELGQVLKQPAMCGSHCDAVPFFKLVASGDHMFVSPDQASTPSNKSCQVGINKRTRILRNKGHRLPYSMYTNSPGGANSSGIGIRDISSPMRVMSLSSPVTPLGALMQSPQLAQKALLRQKNKEQKRLEAALENERHLRSELELDLQDRTAQIQDRDVRLRDLERQLGEARKMRDQLDELDTLRQENNQLTRDLRDLKMRLSEQKDVREQNAMLERENKEALGDLAKAREELSFQEMLKKASEEYRAQCHKQQVQLLDLEARVQHWEGEAQRVRATLSETENSRQVAINNCNQLKREKEELEELLSANNAGMSGLVPVFNGESMNIVTEKRLAEVQAQYEEMRSSWVDPHMHDIVRKQLAQEQQTKQTFEEKYVEAKKREMSLSDQLERLQSTLISTQSSVANLESRLATSQEEGHSLASQVTSLTEQRTRLEELEASLVQANKGLQSKVEQLEAQISQANTQLHMIAKELEVEKEVSENRLKALKSDTQEVEECLREELTTLRLKWDSDSSQLTERVRGLESELDKQAASAEKAKKKHAENVAEYEAHLKDVKEKSEERLNKFQEAKDELEEYKKTSDAAVEDLKCTLASMTKEKKAAEREVHRLGLELENVRASGKTKVDSVESRLSELEKCHQEEVCELKQKNKHITEECQTLKKELQTVNVSFEKKKTELQQSHEHMKDLNSRNGELMCQIEESSRNIMEFENQVKLYNERFNSDAAIRSNLESQIENMMKQFSKEKDSLDAEIFENVKEIAVLTEKMANNEESFKESLASIRDTHAQEVKIQTKLIEQLKSELMKVKNLSDESLKSFESKESDYKTQVEKQKGQITELEFALIEKEAMATTMATQLEYLKGVEKTLKSTLTCLEADNMAIKNLLSEGNQVKGDLHKIISDKEVELTKIKLQMEENQEVRAREADGYSRKMEALKQEFESVKMESSIVKENLEKVIEENKAEIELLKKSLETTSAERLCEKNNLVSQIELLKAECQAHVACRSEYESEINRLKEILNSNLSTQISEKTDYEVQIKTLSAQLSKKESEVNVLQQHITKVTEEKGTSENNFKSNLEVLQASVTEKESQLAELKDKLVETESYWRSQCEELEEEYTKGTQDQKSELQSQLEDLESKYEDKLLKLSNEKDIAMANKDEVLNAKVQELEKMLGDKNTGIANLQVKLDDQNVNYRQMMCEMEEKLSGENRDLKSRISQLKCQYETMIETNEKETRKKVHDLEDKIRELESVRMAIEQELNGERENVNVLKGELAAMRIKVSELEGMISESNCLQVEREERISELEKAVCAARDDVGQVRADRSELERQVEYTRERNDILTAELSSNQQQLAAVEEEKRQLELQLGELSSELTARASQLREQSETEARMWNVEKMELERQLQATQKCYDAVQKSETELEGAVESLTGEKARLETRCQELERKLHAAQEASRQLADDGSVTREQMNKLNGQLVLTSDECRRLTEVNSRGASQLEAMQKELSMISQKYEQEVRQERTACEIMSLELEQAKEKLSNEVKERERLQGINDQYNIHYNQKKKTIVDLQTQLENARVLEERYADQLANKMVPLQDELNVEKAKNNKLAVKTRQLETQLDLAERKLREYKQQLEKGSALYFGDPSHFEEMIADKENAADASFMENHPCSFPGGESTVIEKKRPSSLESISEQTLTPRTRLSRANKRISKSVSASTVASDDVDTVSIGSATSLAYRLRSRESTATLNRSISSHDSCRSNASNVPRGTGGLYNCEDEPMELEWGRIGELSRRNTMCPSHLKTSYPVETQRYNPNRFREDALRESHIGTGQLTASGKKRKQVFDTDSGSDSSDSKNKQAKTGCVYQKPGPPTPGNTRRNSKGSRSPGNRRNSKTAKSPRTPMSLRSRRSPKRTPKNSTPHRNSNIENGSSGKKGLAYDIGFSPLSMNRSTSRLTRQQGFIQKQPQAAGKDATRKPLGIRNYQQTGV